MSALPSITLSGSQLSDLFFNTEKPNYDGVDRLNEDHEMVARELAQALLADAADFSDMVGNAVTPEKLAQDFLKRL